MDHSISFASRLVGVLGLAVALGATPVQGQAAQTTEATPARSRSTPPPGSPAAVRQGMWFSAGLGAGSASLHCQICSGDLGSRGTTGYVRAGTTVNGFFLLGAELDAWMRSDQGGHQRVFALTGNGYWYPDPRHGYYVKGGFGLSNYRQSADGDNGVTTAVTAGAFTGQVGLGYEVRMNPRMSIVPYANLIGSAKGRISTEQDNGTHLERNRLDMSGNVILLQIGLGLTWH
jgi:hypothetical protein